MMKRLKKFSVAKAVQSDSHFLILAGPFPSFVEATKTFVDFAFGDTVWLVRHNEDGSDEIISEMGPNDMISAMSSP